MVKSTVGMGTKNDCSDEDQPTDLQPVSHELKVNSVSLWLPVMNLQYYLLMTSDDIITNKELCVCYSCSDLSSLSLAKQSNLSRILP
jgi:hypothetical protein